MSARDRRRRAAQRLGYGAHPRTLAEAHYRRSSSAEQRCSSCRYFSAGRCSMFNAQVSPAYVCDEWAARGT